MRRRWRSDDGFSLLEVMFAAFVAFFILTALFGLLVVSTRQGRIANTDEVATNLASQVIEQARSLPYESVGTSGAASPAVAGALPSLETTIYRNITFQVRRAVTWVDDPSNNSSGIGDVTKDYKQLRVDVSWAGGHITPIYTNIRDRSNDMASPPLVAWIVPPPPPSKVLFTSGGAARVWAGDPADPTRYTDEAVSVQAEASVSATAGTVIRMELYVDSNLLSTPVPFSGSAATVRWPTPAFSLDLEAIDATTGVELFPDGQRLLKVVGYSNTFASAYQVSYIVVDNHAPAFPDGSTVSLAVPAGNGAKYDSRLDMSWTSAMDGLDPARRFNVAILKYSDASSLRYDWQDLGTAPFSLGSAAPAGFTPTPFTAYRVTLTPRSARGLTGSTSAASAYTSTAPRLTGRVTNLATSKKGATDLNYELNISPPQTGLAALLGGSGGTIVYDVYRLNGPWTYGGSGNLPDTALLVASDQSATQLFVRTFTQVNVYFQIVAKVRDSSGAVVGTMRSNIIGGLTTAPGWSSGSVWVDVPVPR